MVFLGVLSLIFPAYLRGKHRVVGIASSVLASARVAFVVLVGPQIVYVFVFVARY